MPSARFCSPTSGNGATPRQRPSACLPIATPCCAGCCVPKSCFHAHLTNTSWKSLWLWRFSPGAMTSERNGLSSSVITERQAALLEAEGRDEPDPVLEQARNDPSHVDKIMEFAGRIL